MSKDEVMKEAPAATDTDDPGPTPHRSCSIESLPDRMAETSMRNGYSDNNNNTNTNDIGDGKSYTLVAKYGKAKLTLDDLAGDTTVGEIKDMIKDETHILPKRQKLVGLVAVKGGAKGVTDDLPLSELKVKGKTTTEESGMEVITLQFILMGTPEEEIFVDPHERDDLPDVVDDFDLDFNAGSEEWLQHVTNGENLKRFTEKTPVHIMNPPRQGKPLLVLDLDHTLLDFSSKTLQRDSSVNRHVPGQGMAAVMKRPYMDDFLAACYQHFDMVEWRSNGSLQD
jgi:ubiquitin-like domain-containing CTD phosphatase 1